MSIDSFGMDISTDAIGYLGTTGFVENNIFTQVIQVHKPINDYSTFTSEDSKSDLTGFDLNKDDSPEKEVVNTQSCNDLGMLVNVTRENNSPDNIDNGSDNSPELSHNKSNISPDRIDCRSSKTPKRGEVDLLHEAAKMEKNIGQVRKRSFYIATRKVENEILERSERHLIQGISNLQSMIIDNNSSDDKEISCLNGKDPNEVFLNTNKPANDMLSEQKMPISESNRNIPPTTMIRKNSED